MCGIAILLRPPAATSVPRSDAANRASAEALFATATALWRGLGAEILAGQGLQATPALTPLQEISNGTGRPDIVADTVSEGNGTGNGGKCGEDDVKYARLAPANSAISVALAPRGPDSHGEHVVDALGFTGWSATLFASVLAVRGTVPEPGQLDRESIAGHSNSKVESLLEKNVQEACGRKCLATAQPLLTSEAQLCLLWNGEIFRGGDIGTLRDEYDNDGAALARRLARTHDHGEIAAVLSSIEGPWALVLTHNDTGEVYFARSRFGQRSLLLTCYEDGILLSSVAVVQNGCGVPAEWAEIPPGLLFCVRLSRDSPTIDVVPLTYAPTSGSVDSENLTTSIPSSNQVLNGLQESVRLRVRDLPPPRKILEGACCDEDVPAARLGVLFSGGIDSLMLAALAERCHEIPSNEPIDLLNVAFVRTPSAAPAQAGQLPSQLPDRQTGVSGLLQLQRIFPERKWRLICVNVVAEELARYEARIFRCIFPRITIMDMTIGAALWFAARGIGKALCEDCLHSADAVERSTGVIDDGAAPGDCTCHNVECQARVLLVGAGADEQLAGYGRHRTAFRRGVVALETELRKDLDRIWLRNMGRDDRVLSDNGREARFPFLGGPFVTVVQSLALGQIADFSLPPGQGDKRVLRDAARLIGLLESADTPKRAIQFGSRSGKMFSPHNSSKVNGDDVWRPRDCP